MINMNEKMKAIISTYCQKEMEPRIESIIRNIVDHVKEVYQCNVYDPSGDIQEDQIDLEKIILFSGDMTGYEVDSNEIIIDKEDIYESCHMALADVLIDELQRKYSGKKFVVYILDMDESIAVRFHTYREDEGLWLDEDLNKYDEPILYVFR